MHLLHFMIGISYVLTCPPYIVSVQSPELEENPNPVDVSECEADGAVWCGVEFLGAAEMWCAAGSVSWTWKRLPNTSRSFWLSKKESGGLVLVF